MRTLDLCLMLGLLTPAATPQGTRLVVEVGKAWLEPGKAMDRARFTIEVGKLREVDTWQAGQDAGKAMRFADGVATAGFVDLHRLARDRSELGEKAESLTPELRLDKAYDPFDPEWAHLLARGVTSVVLAPAHDCLSGGQAVWVRNGLAPEPDQATSYIGISLTRECQGRDRRPTSLIGALDYMREGYRKLRTASPRRLDPTEQALASTLNGAVKVGFVCTSSDEILGAMTLAAEQRLEGLLILGDSKGAFEHQDLMDLLPRIREAGLGVVLPCLSLRSRPELCALPAELDRAGVGFAFWGSPASRDEVDGFAWTLATAVRRGLATEKALAAVTTTPAAWAGVGDRVGSLYKGREADICIWSGEPWDLRSRLLAVIRRGEIVWKADRKEVER